MSVWCVSDLHGQYGAFLKGLEKIKFGKDDFLWVLGDAVDRGPDGIKILRHIMQADNMDLILGNHEFMMLNAVPLGGGDENVANDFDLWVYCNGGNVTYKSYLMLPENERLELIAWLESRYVLKTVDVGGKKFCLTHSAYLPDFENKTYQELGYENTYGIVWWSHFRHDSTHIPFIYDKFPELVFVTGHVPVQRIAKMTRLTPFTLKNFVNIDGGCAMGTDFDGNGIIFYNMNDRQYKTVELED